MKTYYKVIIPFHYYENQWCDEMVFIKQTQREAQKIVDDFERYKTLTKENHFDSATRILKFYDCYGDGIPNGKPKIVKIEETDVK